MSTLALLYLLSGASGLLGILASILTVVGRKPEVKISQVLLETRIILNKNNFQPLAQKARIAMFVFLLLAILLGAAALFEANQSLVVL